jgi:hypothetical protein
VPPGGQGAGAAKAWSLLVIGVLCVGAAASITLQTRAPTTVIVLRAAETADTGRPNPGLSVAGRARARELIRVVGHIGVTDQVAAVFATRYRDSQETAQPLARQLDLPVQVVDSANQQALLERIGTEYRGRLLVVITDVDALPDLIVGLLRETPSALPIGTAPDRLYIVSLPRVGARNALALRYGAPAASETAGS